MGKHPKDFTEEEWFVQFEEDGEHVALCAANNPSSTWAQRRAANKYITLMETRRSEAALNVQIEANRLAAKAMSWGRCGVYLAIGSLLLTLLIELARHFLE
jgi:hypothetical protein